LLCHPTLYEATFAVMTEEPPQPTISALPPKIAIVQSLLEALMGGTPTDATFMLSNTRRGGTRAPGTQAAATIPALVLEGRSVEALAACQTALHSLNGHSAQTLLGPKITELRKALERELLTAQDIELVTEARRSHLLPQRAVLIGRRSSEKPVDVAVNCRWFSRGERNLSLFCEGATWFLEDLGSTNGSFVQGRALKRGHPFPLPHGITHVDIGKTKDKPGPVVVSLRRPAKDPGAVVISLKAAIDTDAELESDAWPSMKTDINRRWVVFREQIGISAAEDVALDVDGGEQGILAALRYQSGFWIVPSSRHRLFVDGVPFHEPVPLFPGATLSLGGTTFCVDKSQASTRADPISQPQALAREAGQVLE
jgi:hypothetical protein